ncbi:MAG: hypothetical protein ABJE66_18805 [Deltaproteobacteria bacterium]
MRLDADDEIGTISDVHQAFLVAQLEDDDEDNTAFQIDRETIELLSDNDADPDLLALLEKGLGDDDSMTITFEA